MPRLTNAMVPANEPWVRLAMGLSRIICGSAPATPPAEITLTLSGGKLKSLGTVNIVVEGPLSISPFINPFK